MQPIFLRATGDQTGRFPGGKLPESTGPGINPAKRYKFYPLPDIIRRIFKTYPGELQNFQNLEAFPGAGINAGKNPQKSNQEKRRSASEFSGSGDVFLRDLFYFVKDLKQKNNK
jgi:hypothetical protein